MKNFIIRLVIMFIGIFLSGTILSGIEVETYETAIYATLLLAFLNATLRPVLLLLTFPVNLLTLGLFSMFVSGFVVWVVGVMIDGITIDGYLWALVMSLMISFMSAIANEFVEG